MNKEARAMAWAVIAGGIAAAGREGHGRGIATATDEVMKEFDKRFNKPPCKDCHGEGDVWRNGSGGGGGRFQCETCAGTGEKP